MKLPIHGSLTFIDLDSLKRYNDEYGHTYARGDELLCGFCSTPHGYARRARDGGTASRVTSSR